MASRKALPSEPADIAEGVPENLLPLSGISAAELIRRAQARDAWFAALGLGDRRADSTERTRLTRVGLDLAGAVFEGARLGLSHFDGPDPD